MTDAIFYTAYDDMPPMVRLRRGRKPHRGYGSRSLLCLLAIGATALSAVPALGPGGLHMPLVASHALPGLKPLPGLKSLSGLKIADALPVPPDVTLAPALQAAFLAGEPNIFAESHPLASRLVAAQAPAMAFVAEAPAPGVDRAARMARATDAAVPGPQMLAANADDDDAVAAALPSVPAATPLVVADVPLPTPRPNDFAPTPVPAPLRATRRPTVMASATPAPTSAPVVSPDNRSFLEKFFSVDQQPKAATPALGYAAPEDSWFSGLRSGAAGNPARSYGQNTAVYDIASHTVYLPDGSRLEAHSGLGPRLDDPSFVHEPMRGPTPPATYALTMRESLFHGVEALRLTPVGSRVFGRVGLLAHTYMLGPRGDSNGCVSFRDYKTFLRAFKNGDVRRLVVVARLS